MNRERPSTFSTVRIMKREHHQQDESVRSAAHVQIDEVCDEFVGELALGRDPKIEALIEGWDEPERSKLLFELIRAEIGHLSKSGDVPSKQHYLERFPDNRQAVNELFQRRAAEKTVANAKFEETLGFRSTLERLRYLDEGGLGVVAIAEDSTLKRETAVKFLHERLTDDKESCEQFRLEAEVTARLQHPGVVAVYGLGESDKGQPFYVMRLVHGETLDEAIQRFHQPSEDALAVRDRQVHFHELLAHFVAVCETIAYAHNRGIIHRDLKPKNVMIGRYGETVVIDWGLAIPVAREGVFKESAERTLMPSLSGESSKKSGGGTPAYMSPEQADGAQELGPLSDVYSLGAVLYKILTNEIPVNGQNIRQMRERVIRGELTQPSQVKRGVSKPLEAVCLKAMARDPQERYPTALELAKDVNRFLADARVMAYKEPLLHALARWGRRHHVLAHTVLFALIVVTLVGVVIAGWQGSQASQERRLRTEADTARASEYALRTRGLQVSAEFAARTIANQIDVRWRILEQVAADPTIHEYLRAINQEIQSSASAGNGKPTLPASTAPLQKHLNQLTDPTNGLYRDIRCNSWFVQVSNGLQVARAPEFQEDGSRSISIGKNYAFRDYYHAKGEDQPSDELDTRPLTVAHNSSVMKSTNGGNLVVALSVPIRANGNNERLGVLGMSIELGTFADLQIDLPEEQRVLLVESRKYHMLGDDWKSYGDRGEGLVLHHEALPALMLTKPSTLPHIDDKIVDYMRKSQVQWQEKNANGGFENLLPDHYRDPLEPTEGARWLAAFAPVLVNSRSKKVTGWFVIVQQRQ